MLKMDKGEMEGYLVQFDEIFQSSLQRVGVTVHLQISQKS